MQSQSKDIFPGQKVGHVGFGVSWNKFVWRFSSGNPSLDSKISLFIESTLARHAEYSLSGLGETVL